MAQSTYKMTGLVLRKTKLGESDLIITLLGEDGSLRKGVAKGARKPSSPFAARLELYNKVDLLCASGKSLDIIKESRLVFSGGLLHSDMDKSIAAACASELACRFMQPSLENPRLYEMTEKLLETLNDSDARLACALVGAYYLKCFSVCGIRPSLVQCVSCGSKLDDGVSGTEAFSYEEGGYVCDSCSGHYETLGVSSSALLWSNAMLYSTFDAIKDFDIPSSTMFEMLQICQQWCRVHVGSAMKSLRMFMGLYAAE